MPHLVDGALLANAAFHVDGSDYMNVHISHIKLHIMNTLILGLATFDELRSEEGIGQVKLHLTQTMTESQNGRSTKKLLRNHVDFIVSLFSMSKDDLLQMLNESMHVLFVADSDSNLLSTA
jgi:hypothetical protein